MNLMRHKWTRPEKPNSFPQMHLLTAKNMSLVLLIAFAIIVPLSGQNAEEILQSARMNPTSHPSVLRAQIRGDGHLTPLTIRLRDRVVSYEFTHPEQSIFLKLDQKDTSISEKLDGKIRTLSESRLHENIRDTGVTYEDLSLGFLYWPKPILQGEQTIRRCPAWKIDLQAPTGESLYGAARVWINKDSGAILRIEGYDKKGLLLRRFEVVSVQKIDELWMLKQMRIESFLPGNPDPITRCYLEVMGKN